MFAPSFPVCSCFFWQSFGYVVEGADFLSDVDEGDIIVSAKVTNGAENLLPPSSSSSA